MILLDMSVPKRFKPMGAELRREHDGKTPSRIKYDDEWYEVSSYKETMYSGRIYYTWEGERIPESYVEDMEFDDEEEEDEEEEEE